jgi:anthranilate phosphoribosyltransferase
MYVKGEAPVEIEAAIAEMLKFSLPISIPERSVDIVGTGGDGAHTINIFKQQRRLSRQLPEQERLNMALVPQPQNRDAADCLQALGVNIDLDGVEVAQTVYKFGYWFLLCSEVPALALRFAAPARKEITVPTMFNVCGPLANPAQPKAIAFAVANPKMLPVMAKVLLDRGCEGFIFRGDDGLDEISLESRRQRSCKSMMEKCEKRSSIHAT